MATKYKEIIDSEFADFFALSVELNTPKLFSVYSLLSKEQVSNIVQKLEKNAKEGSAFANYQLAQINYNGIPYLEKNREEGLYYLKQAASLQNAKAMYELYEKADYANKNEYLPYLKQAAQQDYIPALMRLANYYRTSYDEGVERSDALACYIKAANLGNVEAILVLASLYEYGDYYLDLDQDLGEVIKWYTLAIQKQTNNIRAYKNLANIYLNKSTPPNVAKAYELINHAYTLDSNDKEVLAMLANIYSINDSEYKDIQKAITIYEALLADSDLDKELRSEYSYVLGLLYISNELGDKKEYDRAFDCFTEVLKTKKHAIAYFNIAEIYRLGLGRFGIDLQKAKDNYRLAKDNSYNQYYEELTNLHLANILIASDDQKELKEAIELYISLLSDYPNKYDFSDVILTHIQFNSSQKWLYNVYRKTKLPHYLNHINKGAKSGIVGLQYYKALLDYETNQSKGIQELTKLAENQYIPALRKLSDWSDGMQKIEWKIKIATLTNSDSDIYDVLNAYRSNNNYENVLVWYQKLKDPDY
ncbi:SEL1-like repeat protein [Bacteroides propionicifaciens]|nr:tetratricopeptide repeat protein [Bacteroides propionicifaciens]